MAQLGTSAERWPAEVDASGRRLFVGVTAALTALVVLTGCGGSSSSSSTASAGSWSSSSIPGATGSTSAIAEAARHCDPEPCQLTPADLAARLDELCLRGNAAVKRAVASLEQATKTRGYTQAAAAMESALREFPPYQLVIQGLTPPAQDRAAFTRYVDLTRSIHGLSERIAAAGHGRETPGVSRLSQLVQEELATRTRTAVDLGTKHCREQAR